MDLTYSPDQIALKDSAEKLLAERYTADLRETPGSFRKVMAAQGWYGLLIDEAQGGLGLGMEEACLLAEALGRHLSREAFVSHVYASSLAAGLAPTSLRDGLLQDLAAGTSAIAISDQVATLRIEHAGDRNVRLSGVVKPLLDVADGTQILLAARDGTATHLFRLDDRADLQIFQTVDGRPAASLTLEGTRATDLGAIDDNAVALAFDRAVAAQVADISGAMQAALEATTAYAKIRVQFGQPIGANQVIKHRLVEMAVRCEEARSLALKAAIRTSDGSDATTRARAVSGAKVKIAAMARAVTEDAVQIHGGMGVTDELDIGWYLKRSIAFDATFGTTRWHRTRYRASVTA